MSIYKLFSQWCFLNLIIRALPIFLVMCTILFKPCLVVWAQTYNIQNERILAPEVSHFTGVKEPGVDARGDLHLSIPLMTVPGRDGLNFDLVANYSSGIKVMQSASWIGWGWSLDVGSITRHPLGGLDRWHFNDRNGDGQPDAEQVDFALALSGQTRSQPDAYTVTMNGNTVDLISTTLGVIPTPFFIFDPHQTENYGSCGPGTATHSRWHFTASPWRPWKFCYAKSNPVTVDCRSTGTELGTREDIYKLMITTEDGTRYIYGMPTLSYASFPPDHQTGTNYSFVSTWRLIAIHAPNYSGSEIPTSTSTGGWVKIVYKTVHSQTGALVDVETISDGPTCSTGNIIQQITYPYYIETPTHYALFATSKRYDRDLVKGGLGGAGVDANYYSRKLDKITLYKKTEPGGAIPNSTDKPVLEVAFTYLNNGANSLVSSYTPTIHGKMLSKLTLEKITITGLQSNGQGQVTATQSLPSYKFSYYDYKDVNPNDPTGGWLSWDDVAGNPSIHVLNYQDDFGFLDFPSGDSRRHSNEAYGTAWSLKEITYPDGGQQRIIYESDKIGTGGVSPPPSFTYNVYTVCGTQNATYQANLSASFSRTFQGGPRVKAVRTYSGYNESTPDSISFTYGEGFYSGISEGKFLKIDNGSEPFYVSGDRGQFNITYAWIEKKLSDNSKIRTHYVTGNGPEFQIFYKGGVSGPTRAIFYGNTTWNWGESDSVKYFDANSTLVKKEINYWSFYGTTPSDHKIAAVAPSLCYGGTTCPQGSCSQGTPEIYLNFTHKQLDSVVTKNYFGSNTVTSRVAYEYNDGTLLSKSTETSADGKKRITENTYAHDLSGAPYSGTISGMRYKNMRSQVAQTSVKDNNPTSNGYASTVTTWKDIGSKYLPDKEFRWRKDKTGIYSIPVFDGSIPQESNGWILTQTFDQYDQHGNLTSVKDADNIATSIFWDATGTLIDSIATRPNAATTLTTRYAYDPNTFRLTSITDPNNQKNQFKYHPLQRLIETIMPDKRTASDFAYYYSRQGVNNNDTFNSVDPNYIKTRSLTGPGFFEPFEYTDSPTNHGWVDHVGSGNGTMSTVYDNTLQSQVMRVDVLPGYANDSYAVRYPATGELGVTSTHLWVKVKNSFATSSFRLVVRYANQDYFLVYYFDSGTNYYDIPSRSVVVYTGTIYQDGAWHTLERDLEQDFRIAGLGANYEYIKRIIVRGEYDLDDIQLLNHPVTTLSFADGLGRDIQTLQYDKGGSIKGGTFYDALDRVIKVTKPFFHANAKFTRVDSVIAYANNYYSTQHPVYYDGPSAQEYDTGNYAYSETEYYPDPLNRVRHQYFPGAVFSRADTNYVKYRYGMNAANEMGITNAGSVFETRIFDENDVKTEIFTDTFGNKVAVRNDSSGVNNDGNTTKLATAFQYDILGHFLKIAPPKAFQIANNNIPDWNSAFCTSMTYDTWGLLRSRKTPDAGTDSMYYDKKGNLRFVKDANGAAGDYFIYYKYDNLNRKIEEGTMSPVSGNFKQSHADIPTYPSSGFAMKVKFQYDSTTYAADAPQLNLKGRLAVIEYVTDRYPAMTGYMFYSYDVNGNLEWIQHFIPKSNVNDGNGNLVAMTNYYYDALGNVTKIYFHRTFPPGASPDAFYVWYDYDVRGRLEKVFTNTADVKPATPNAQYIYWPGGQVKRLVLGGSVQGIDYLYNSRDWLTQINHQNIYYTQDPGGDGGGSGVPNADKFGQILGYDKQAQIANGHPDFVKQHNGNISWTISNTFGNNSPVGSSLTGWVFKYDKANRLTKANWGHYSAGWQTSNRYDLTGLVYDRHGNLEYMTRYDQNGVATNMDYKYGAYPNTNKLEYISGLSGHTTLNYVYDDNGNMIKDAAKLGSTSTISYDYRNLPAQVPKTTSPAGTIYFSYDGKGQRVSKNNLFYVPGADGRVMAVYDANGTLLYWNIWGLDLIGQKFWKQ